MSASGTGRSAENRIVPFETEKPPSSVRTASIAAGGEREDREVMGAGAHADQRLARDLECRYSVADAVDRVRGYACRCEGPTTVGPLTGGCEGSI
jgi:hypothetical protein